MSRYYITFIYEAEDGTGQHETRAVDASCEEQAIALLGVSYDCVTRVRVAA